MPPTETLNSQNWRGRYLPILLGLSVFASPMLLHTPGLAKYANISKQDMAEWAGGLAQITFGLIGAVIFFYLPKIQESRKWCEEIGESRRESNKPEEREYDYIRRCVSSVNLCTLVILSMSFIFCLYCLNLEDPFFYLSSARIIIHKYLQEDERLYSGIVVLVIATIYLFALGYNVAVIERAHAVIKDSHDDIHKKYKS